MFCHPRSMMKGRSIMPAPKKRLPKPNPAREVVTVELPRHLPEGVEFVYSRTFGDWVFQTKTRKGIRNLLDMARNVYGRG